MRWVLFLAVLVAGFLPGLAVAQTPGNLDLTRIPPPLADLPTGFSPVPSRTLFVSNAELVRQAPDPEIVTARLSGWGRINGYNAVYERDGFAAWVETARIVVMVGLYSGPDGAQSAGAFKVGGFHGSGYVDVSMPSVGETWRSFTRTVKSSNGLTWREYVVQFSEGSVNVSVSTIATAGTSSFEEALDYARGMVARIREGRTYSGI